MQVLLCSDSVVAKKTVAQLCRDMGFIPVDLGRLCSARDIENAPLRLFPAWTTPAVCTVSLFLFFYLYNFLHDVLHPYIKDGKNVFYKLPIDTVNVTLPSVAMVMLALVYIPGLLAAFLQLWHGTKYRRFPDWLDRWLKARKQMGLLAFLCAALHAVYSLCLPMRRSARYKMLNAAYRQVSKKCLMKGNAYCMYSLTQMRIVECICLNQIITQKKHVKFDNVLLNLNQQYEISL